MKGKNQREGAKERKEGKEWREKGERVRGNEGREGKGRIGSECSDARTQLGWVCLQEGVRKSE